MATFRRKSSRIPERAPTDNHRVNDRITSREVRVISDSGEQLGVLTVRAAIELAERSGLDLVEVAPQAKPPVCRVMDYGKFKYREQKKEAEARKKRSEVVTKELRIRYRTDHGDLETKLKHARDFLLEGDKVKFSMKFKGREIMYTELGQEKFTEIVENLADIATVDDKSPPSGRQIHITLAPTKEALAKHMQQKLAEEKKREREEKEKEKEKEKERQKSESSAA